MTKGFFNTIIGGFASGIDDVLEFGADVEHVIENPIESAENAFSHVKDDIFGDPKPSTIVNESDVELQVKNSQKPKLPHKKTGPGKRTGMRGGNNTNGGKSKSGNVHKSFINRASLPAAIGHSGHGHSFKGMGSAIVLGSPAHIFRGRCAFQNLATNAGGGFVFLDSASNQGTLVFMNPRICCQNSGYSIPAGNCPIGVIAQPFRKYSFRKLKITYEPLAVSTTMTATVAYAYDPEVITTSVLGTSSMAFANFEASAYGPIWRESSLDLTKWLDKSKWYYGETPVTPATSLIAAQSIQGTLVLCSSNGPAVSTQYGMFYMDFELALSELGPTEVFSAPALLLGSGKDEVKTDKPAETSPPTPEGWVRLADLPKVTQK